MDLGLEVPRLSSVGTAAAVVVAPIIATIIPAPRTIVAVEQC
jgi:hypothetical protein